MISQRALKKLAFTIGLSMALIACDSNPLQPEVTSPPKAQLQFVDLQGFDRDLTGSLSAPLPEVDVAFYNRMTPSALPERIQNWMAAVEAGGGTVQVVPPPSPSRATSKSPFLLISAITSLWSASKMAKEMAMRAQFRAAQSYDAKIILKKDDKGESLVEKVVFTLRQ